MILLGVQFAFCDASKYLFFLRYGSGPMYKPSTRDFLMTLHDVSEDAVEEVADVAEDSLHPDHRLDLS